MHIYIQPSGKFTLKVEIQTENVHTTVMRFTQSQMRELIELEGKVSIALLSYVTHKMLKKRLKPASLCLIDRDLLLQMELWLRKH